ncbi:Membrane-spanning 4-domains subfamily A member 4D [Merluccius polli]|uniref:Membrane-spanning 4-domains subfamily A member 4D n=1 Tax=Merluccius polli TaxID=89951 RepID=A0AA47M0B7_MERPO|nr:Membrane-spanning 4-domains subfamily A member 4D [Merluccius polli]
MSLEKFESFGVKMEIEEGEEEQTALVSLTTFQRGHPTLLGAIQITIGVIMLAKVVVMFFIDVDLQIISTLYWGFIFYITAGSMAIATNRKLTRPMVRGTLGTNLLANLGAIAGGILHFYVAFTFPSCHTNNVCFYLGLSEMAMVALCMLEFIVSILVVFFALRALCSSS